MTASSVLPARRKKSPSTLNSRPCDEAAPMPVCRFLTPWPLVGAPYDELRIPAIGDGVTLSSATLLCEGRGGKESRLLLPSDKGKSDGEGNVGRSVAFRYSFPGGLSKVCTYTASKLLLYSKRRNELTTGPNSLRMWEQRSANKVPI
jgi:hypothetical protein